jgi:cob(I)alamin adenosyltransferase
MAPFYTSKGDAGDTGFLGSGRISKSSLRIEAVGSVDEASAALGLARALTESEKIRTIVLYVQKQLYHLMSELSADPSVADQFDKIKDEDVKWLENQIASLEDSVVLPREFIVPGESPASGALALARTIVRRAERRATALLEEHLIEKPLLIAFLNRLSSLIFILEVYEASLSGRGVRLAKED